MHAAMQAISFLSTLFVFVIGVGVLALLAIFVLDRLQTHDAILRNYPVVGHLRYVLSGLGEFFRQYFFAMDRDELPFNRAERNWVDRAARDAELNRRLWFDTLHSRGRHADLRQLSLPYARNQCGGDATLRHWS